MPLEIMNDRRLLRALLGCALGALLLVAGGVGAAMAEDDDDDTFDTKFMKGILSGLGLKSGNESTIDYHERSPLVVPPTRDLPPPETTGATAAAKNPAWPKDADVERRTTNKKKKTTKPTNVNLEDDMRQLRPEELKAGAKNTAKPSPLPTQSYSDVANPAMKPSELGFGGFTFDSVFGRKEQPVPFTGEPPRASLTEPPAGLRTPASSQPYGANNKLEPTKQGGDSSRHVSDSDR